ncbi:hypothetical protein SISSUDRAFT_1057827 [Sistotremastrum suecicum HHB10207 ss-3]|uniref:Protein Asterix n=1 Tax=Sistotremastrum suecicum HHB10207 ss-3 TaxID=1314776 RepID=A0A166I662_9AGAM|nr:hypothetical protein SISSUDRAFT_1057827 [Sistotremastrum suecicum HHB10207 ss-3]
MSQLDDPRDASLEVPLSPPRSWKTSEDSGTGGSAMFLSAAVMVTRNRYLAWPALFMALSNHFNQQPMRSKDNNNTLISIMVSFFALLTSYLATFVVPPDGTPVPLQYADTKTTPL